MKRNISRYLFSICMIFILAVTAVSVIPVQAAATYTLTFRSGNVGSFDTAKVGAAVKNSSLVEVKKEYIKVKAKRGDSVASAVYDAFGRAVLILIPRSPSWVLWHSSTMTIILSR